MITQSGVSEYLRIAEDDEYDSGLRDQSLALDGLYDLAKHLARDDSEAERLMAMALRAFTPRALESIESMRVLRSRMVRNYLRQNCSFVGRLARLANDLKVRGRRPRSAASWVEAGLNRLSPKERACLILRERLELSVAEIAQATGLERQRVNSALFSARERMTAFLPDEDA